MFDPKEVGGDSSENSGGSTRKRDNKDDDGAPRKNLKKLMAKCSFGLDLTIKCFARHTFCTPCILDIAQTKITSNHTDAWFVGMKKKNLRTRSNIF